MSEINIQMTELEAEVTEADHIRGPEEARLVLVEYADYQCRNCIEGFGAVEKLMETHGDRLRLVFRHFPLVTHHPMAMPAALAAEAAGEQGRFWEMHERVFSAAGEFDDADLVRWAEELGLDMERFERDRHSDELEERVRTMRLEGARSGVAGTPAFFLDNWLIDVTPTHEHLAAYVDHFLAHMDE